MKANFSDTIAAIATPPGIGGGGIIRLSGKKSFPVLTNIFQGPDLITPRYLYHGHIVNSKTKNVLDEVCVVFFTKGHSFTGEEVVEIHCHGGYLILKSVLNLVLAQGCRLAGKGEFTKRAFLNGKIDLTKAESIIDLIHAKSEKAHLVALNHLQGKLFQHISKVRRQLIVLLEQIEASIDFPDEVVALDHVFFLKVIEDTQSFVHQVLKNKDYGAYVSDGIKTLILGKPNTGKSSLLNMILGENRAIVSALPGTTRDFINAQLELDGILFEFFDTAGYRKAHNIVEQTGIKYLAPLIRKADIVLWVLDQTRAFTAEDQHLHKALKAANKKTYLLINKTDLKTNKLKDPLQYVTLPDVDVLPISAKYNQGIDQLKAKLLNDFVKKYAYQDLDLICNVRQIACFQKIEKQLRSLKKHLNQGFEDDVLAIDLKNVILNLGEITGEEITEEVLDGIFSRFCVGK